MGIFAEALAIFRDTGDAYSEIHTLHNMAETELVAERPNGDDSLLDAVRLGESLGSDTRNLAQALHRLGQAHLALGSLGEAGAFLRAVRIVKEKSDTVASPTRCSASARPGSARGTPSRPGPPWRTRWRPRRSAGARWRPAGSGWSSPR
ncbi:hypothetical protein SVIOM342S_07962 [Streptomyces violaceorubidus]